MAEQLSKYTNFIVCLLLSILVTSCHFLSANDLHIRNEIANLNLRSRTLRNPNLKDGDIITFKPGSNCPPFKLYTLDGLFSFPEHVGNKSVILHVFNPDSGFLESLWAYYIYSWPFSLNETLNTIFVFIPSAAAVNKEYGAIWMRQRVLPMVNERKKLFPEIVTKFDEIFKFSVEPLYKLGNFLPDIFGQWQCVDHNCGLDQVLITRKNNTGQNYPLVRKRLDARYDWLPSPPAVFKKDTLTLQYVDDDCQTVENVKGAVTLVLYLPTCSYLQQIKNMQKSGAAGVIIMAMQNESIFDMYCFGPTCMEVSIPASIIPYDKTLLSKTAMTVTYQNTPSENFFIAVDRFGALAEVGWFLYPTMDFLTWQAQWFNYKYDLDKKLLEDRLTVSIFENKTMQGQIGVKVNVTLPPISALKQYKQIYLDMSLSCPGNHDEDCAHWDHTVNLYICCDQTSRLCNMELGRWITPFRRRIGRWLSDVSPLLPLMANQTCTFTMKTAPWAMPWVPSLKLHFQQKQPQGGLYPAAANVLYEPGATFNKTYNSNFKPYLFEVPDGVKKVVIYAVITGHGSDENGCGEFCITSHHFQVNSFLNNITFSSAGSQLGCAEAVPTGVEPNEHGTWLYGRDGWCDGRNVFPWVIDVTDQVQADMNVIHYFGLFQGKDPNPQHNPGVMIFYSYIVYYKPL